MTSEILFLVIVFFLIALIYSSVGFGGGSSYLALLALSGVSYLFIRPTALLCNIIVVTGGTFIYYKNNHIDLKKIWPFLLLSIPASFIGGFWRLQERTFFLILSIALIVAAILLWMQNTSAKNTTFKSGSLQLNAIIGGLIGFLSGLVGIGGGIFLSPVLHFIKWDDVKKISGLASVFILVNSMSGLIGQISRGVNIQWEFILPLLTAVLVGGQIGSRIGARRLDPDMIRKVTAILILVAGINILKDQL